MRGGVVSFQICFGGDKIFPFSSCRHFFFAFKARSMSVSFRGQQRADDEGIRQGSTPIKYAVKQEDFIGGEGFGAFGLDDAASSADLCPKTREPTSAPSRKQKVEAGKPVEESSSEVDMHRCWGIKTAAARCHGRMKRDEKEGYGCTFTPSASSNSTMTPVSSV